MKTIERFESKDFHEENYTIYWAYHESKETGNDLMNFSDVIWDRDIETIVRICREEGIEAFTVSSTFSGMLETLAGFEALGCKLAGLTKIKSRITPYNPETGREEPRYDAAALITLN